MRGIELLPNVSTQRREVENIIINGVRLRQAENIIRPLRILYGEHNLYPENCESNIYCFEDQTGKFLLAALGHAIQTGYTEGIIVLFEEKRAERLLECVVAENSEEHHSLVLLQQILRLSQDTTTEVADLYKQMLDWDRSVHSSNWIKTMQALVLSASIHTEIEHLEHKPRASRGKKI